MSRLLLLFCSIILLQACVTSNQVVSKRLMQKRKYTKGWHFNSSQHSRIKSDKEFEAHLTLIQEDSFSHQTEKDLTMHNKEEHTLTQEVFENNEKQISQIEAQPHILKSIIVSNNLKNTVSIKIPQRKTRYTAPNTPDKKLQSETKKLEPFGLVSAILAVLCLLLIIIFLGQTLEIVALMIFSLITGVISLILAIISLIRIAKHKDQYRGLWLAIIGIIAGSLLLAFGGVLGILLWAFN